MFLGLFAFKSQKKSSWTELHFLAFDVLMRGPSTSGDLEHFGNVWAQGHAKPTCRVRERQWQIPEARLSNKVAVLGPFDSSLEMSASWTSTVPFARGRRCPMWRTVCPYWAENPILTHLSTGNAQKRESLSAHARWTTRLWSLNPSTCHHFEKMRSLHSRINTLRQDKYRWATDGWDVYASYLLRDSHDRQTRLIRRATRTLHHQSVNREKK